MTAGPRQIGRLSDGLPVHAAFLEGEGLLVEVLDYGCTLRSLRARGVEVLVGPSDIVGLEADRGYFGRVIGRVANRIGGARFELDGEEVHLDANEGANTLHGGARSWSHAVWSFEAVEPRRCVLAHVSPDGDMGFPGEVRATVAFTLVGEDALEIVWEAQADRATPVNLTHHLYVNLNDRPGSDILDHRLTVAGAAITAIDADLIPTGELLPVEGTPFDLREGCMVRNLAEASHPQIAAAGGLDHNWALEGHLGEAPQIVLASPASGLRLEITTDQPGCQIYGGHGIAPPLPRFGGLAIEPQGFPDAPNRPTFPSVTLRPDAPYRRRTLYRLPTP